MRQWLCLSLLSLYAYASAYGQTAALTLEQAWQLAEKANPSLRKAEASLLAALGEVADGRSPLFINPQISVESGRRRIQDGGQSGTANDWAIGLSQTIEIAGQPRARRDAAERALEATRQEIEEVRRQLRAEVERRFVDVLALQVREEIEQRSAALIEGTAIVVRKRVAAGEDSKLDGNLAVVEAERARSQLGELQEQLVQARAGLASVVQWSEAELPRVSGVLDPRNTSYSLPDLLKAMQARPAVRALELAGGVMGRRRISRRRFLEGAGSVLAVAAAAPVLGAQPPSRVPRSGAPGTPARATSPGTTISLNALALGGSGKLTNLGTLSGNNLTLPGDFINQAGGSANFTGVTIGGSLYNHGNFTTAHE